MPFIEGMFDTPPIEGIPNDFARMVSSITEDVLGGKGGILTEQKPTFEKYLGEKTPFTRMWCAVNTVEIDKETGQPKKETSKIKHRRNTTQIRICLTL